MKMEAKLKTQNLSTLSEMVTDLKTKKISNLQQERIKIDWLKKINIDLTTYIYHKKFEGLFFWRIEDFDYLHMELSQSTPTGATDPEY
mmetsp:Transcript_8484/g.12992  ORF Transcript_8484/g.12992 Transcript_8484/m.12992 type:complete len:88 (+) Transcript_8484:2903-3166(+)